MEKLQLETPSLKPLKRKPVEPKSKDEEISKVQKPSKPLIHQDDRGPDTKDCITLSHELSQESYSNTEENKNLETQNDQQVDSISSLLQKVTYLIEQPDCLIGLIC